jgi:hypothetical protein
MKSRQTRGREGLSEEEKEEEREREMPELCLLI